MTLCKLKNGAQCHCQPSEGVPCVYDQNDLLPCPFCGSQVALSVLEDDEPGEIISAWVHCPCGIEMHERRTEAEAVAKWNCRAVSNGKLKDG
jgi:Lar family restriction alleviation protein